MSPPLPAYDVAAIQAGLQTAAFGRTLHYHESLPSTNTTAITLAQEGARHGTLVLADAQTAGRGRRGRLWHSPPGRNVYCSTILRLPPSQAEYLTIIPLASALAVADAIADLTAVQCRLKWPNDVLIRNKKVAGFLCESVGGQSESIVIVGIGINVNSRPDDFPDDTRAMAMTLLSELGRPVDRSGLVSTLMNRLEERTDGVSPHTMPHLFTAYRNRCDTLGQLVRAVLGNGEVIEGLAETIDPDGSLLIRLDEQKVAARTGRLVRIRSADIVHLRRVTDTGAMG
ncbi:MAG TPA: biotin--[acetyl-CoA-carboxylase] ligase [Nitrospiraceae bacterium]|nr:biotin--[acetyl-CoA-carboxylase] ligase [Nitrospiraceae bacterium]